MMQPQPKPLFLVLLAVLSPALQADLAVIHDAGVTTPLPGPHHLSERLANLVPPTPALPADPLFQFWAKRFPIHTPELQPGPVVPQPVQLPAAPPVFLIGTDALSRTWLTRYRDKLMQAHAFGLVVEAESAAAYAELAQLAGPLPLSPVSGTPLAKRLGLSHYPVLIGHGLIEQ